MDDRLIDLIAAKQTMKQAADALNAEFGTAITRNAIAGRLRRLRLQVTPEPPKPAVVIPLPALVIKPVLPPVPPSGEKTIYQLRTGDCKWPLGEVNARPPYLYCGQPAIEDMPYCREHHKRSYVKPKLVRS
jgi:hypothetical protein